MERVGRGPGRPHWEPVTPCLTTFSVLTMMLLLAEPVVSQANPGDLWLAGIAAAAGVARADSCHDLAAAQSYECKAAGGVAPLEIGLLFDAAGQTFVTQDGQTFLCTCN